MTYRVGPRSTGRLLAVLLLVLAIPGSAALTASRAHGPSESALLTGVLGSGAWHASWSTALVSPPDTSVTGYANQTLRMVAHLSAGGSAVRVRLANTFGLLPVTFGRVYIGRAGVNGAVRSGTSRPLSFGGAPSVTVAPGKRITSDPVSLTVASGSDLSVSVYLPAGGSGPASWHPNARATTYVSSLGDHAKEESSAAYTPSSYSWFFLDGIDVQTAAQGAIVAFGDSITDGAGSTMDANHRYPDRLAARLRASGIAKSVVNAGIGGNRMLTEGLHYGQSALDRFDRDVLGQTRVTDVIVLEGINDIGLGPQLTAADLIAAHRELIRRAHAKGLRIYGGTLLPYRGATYFTDRGEQVRRAVNRWLRTSGAYDAVIDFDAAIRDPADPSRMRPAYDSGDHLHPSDAGYQAMADAVSLRLFQATSASPQPVGVR